ncbi:uncharacterized protein LOC114163608 [Vigna unguiculata]|uniref:uncharacterized protein LOC114163608 n=1 Tax=Vigna unguiculata TaxID=3917 RepID=UPI0010167046|nr:uncharacterized protein LOC114163608 [Vigna unguiculata]
MATTPQAEVGVPLKLVVNKETNKVLFAEARKDFVDVLFSFLTLPLGTIARLVGNESNIGPVKIGSLNSLYHSVAALDDNCLTAQAYKERLLRPWNMAEDFCNTLKLNIDDTPLKQYFVCNNFCAHTCSAIMRCTSNSVCSCGRAVNQTVFLKSSANGFVNDDAIFVITDDLIVMPNSMDYLSFALVLKLGIKFPSSLKEITVNVTTKKVVDLLKCSMLSKSCLTDLFLEKKPVIQKPTFVSCSVENNSNINIKLKLVIRKSDGKILYALGEKDFADMLLSFLNFALGGVIQKLGGNCSVGSIDGLYESVTDMSENLYFMSKVAKSRLVDPHLLPLFKSSAQILATVNEEDLKYLLYYSNKEAKFLVQFLRSCEGVPDGGNYLGLMPLTDSESATESIVKGSRMFVVTDDLVVAPSSPISDLNIIIRLNTSFLDLKEKDVTIGLMECLNILKASLTSTSALTVGLGHLISEVKEGK